MDLLTLDNMTFSGDPRYHILQYYTHHTSSLLHKNVTQFCHARYSIVVQNPTNWALVIENVQAR